MKKKVAKTKRIGILIVSILIAVICIILIILECISPATNLKEVQEYNHEWEEVINWRSSLVPNELFDSPFLYKDDFIFKDFTKSVVVYYEIPFIFSEPVEIRGSYQIVGYLEALYGEDDDLLWKKRIPIDEEKEFSNMGDSFTISDEGYVSLKKMRDLIDRETKDIDLVAEHQYRVAIEIQGEIVRANNIIPFKIQPNVCYPLSQDAAKGEVALSDTTSYEITKEIEENLPINKTKLFIISIIGLLSVVVVVLTLVATVGIETDGFSKFAKNIFRQHGDRMVKIPNSLELDNGNVMVINSVIDMVKTADEINQPIFYYYENKDAQRQLQLYVFDDSRIYYFNKLDK